MDNRVKENHHIDDWHAQELEDVNPYPLDISSIERVEQGDI